MPRFLAALLLILALPLPVRADYKRCYLDGLEAVDRNKWEDAAKKMREALDEKSQEGEKVKSYGVRFETYLPHFYLGLALVHTGDCDGALKAFAASEEQGAIRGTNRYAELQDERKKCEAKVAKAATPVPPPTPRPTPRPTTAAEPTAVPAPTPVPRSPEPSAGSATPTPPPSPEKHSFGSPELLAAARAYFEGRYGDAAASLASGGSGSGRAAAQALLLRSASRYALYRIGGEQDAPLLKRAAEDAAAARRADPSLMPDERAFSPAFVKFFRESR